MSLLGMLRKPWNPAVNKVIFKRCRDTQNAIDKLVLVEKVSTRCGATYDLP
jgi:hypothetical protein